MGVEADGVLVVVLELHAAFSLFPIHGDGASDTDIGEGVIADFIDFLGLYKIGDWLSIVLPYASIQ